MDPDQKTAFQRGWLTHSGGGRGERLHVSIASHNSLLIAQMGDIPESLSGVRGYSTPDKVAWCLSTQLLQGFGPRRL